MNVLDVREAALAQVRALWRGQPGERYVLAGPYRSYRDVAVSVRRILGKSERVRALPYWTKGFGTMLLALASGFWPDMPNGWTVPSFRYGFVAYHLSGARADRTFELTHRPPEETVFDTLRWFRETGLAPWLPERWDLPSPLGFAPISHEPGAPARKQPIAGAPGSWVIIFTTGVIELRALKGALYIVTVSYSSH
jgi:hypothetical protein